MSKDFMKLEKKIEVTYERQTLTLDNDIEDSNIKEIGKKMFSLVDSNKRESNIDLKKLTHEFEQIN